MSEKKRSDARRRALRAARAVTLGLAMVGCGESHSPDDVMPTDASVDASSTCDPYWETEACCEEFGGIWDDSGACAVPGPFVPPAMGWLSSSRLMK